jgi:hypothetical protein
MSTETTATTLDRFASADPEPEPDGAEPAWTPAERTGQCACGARVAASVVRVCGVDGQVPACGDWHPDTDNDARAIRDALDQTDRGATDARAQGVRY